MITLEQIRLLEGKITKAIELIRVLKEENSTLRKGLESAQKRMKELESLVDGFKTDQREIESVIVRTLRTLDELEESSATKRQERAQGSMAAAAGGIQATAPGGMQAVPPGGTQAAAAGGIQAASLPPGPAQAEARRDVEPQPTKEELDIF
jgi:hypothetical protein